MNYHWLKLFAKIFFILFIISFITLTIIFNDTASDIFMDFLEWLEDNLLLGSLAFMGIYWISTVILVPGLILTLGAGFIYNEVLGIGGIFLATGVVLLGAMLGATTAFVVARFILRDSVTSLKDKYPKFEILEEVIKLNGFKVTFLLRLSPIIPFNVFNYFVGLTSISFKDYNKAHLGLIPGTLAFCFVGGSLSSLTEVEGMGFSDSKILIIVIAGTVLTVLGMIGIIYYGKKEFKKLELQVQQQHEEQQQNDVVVLDVSNN